MRKVDRKQAIIVVATIGVVGASLIWGLLESTPEAAPEPGYVHLVSAASIEETIITTGMVRPATTVELRAQTSGLVEEMRVQPGARVQRGQVLVRLASALADAAVDEAEAQLRQAHLQETLTQLDLDHEAVELERRAYGRAQDLHERGLLSTNDLEQHRLKLRLAERALERNRSARRSSLAHIEQARAKVERARAQQELTVVRAPFDATVLRRFVDVGSGVSGVGQSADGGTVLMTLGDSRRSAFHANVTAADAQRLEPGMPARVRFETAGGELVEGQVELVSSAGEVSAASQLATFPIVVTLTSARTDWVNLPARAEIVVNVAPSSTVVPPGCIRTDDEGRSFVLVETGDDAPERRDVELGAIQPDRLEIRSGLEAGQLVRCR